MTGEGRSDGDGGVFDLAGQDKANDWGGIGGADNVSRTTASLVPSLHPLHRLSLR